MNLRTCLCLLAWASCCTAWSQPIITLPWGVWQADWFSGVLNQVYIFQNVRFGAKPQRFQLPKFPTTEDSSVQDSSYGPACIQLDKSTLKGPPPGGSNSSLQCPETPVEQSEDCLFLDIYAPASNFDDSGNPIEKLPVIVWFYGGAYAFGSKQLRGDVPLYSGDSMIHAMSENSKAIFVVGNYRLGALGWLAGSYMESVAQPNAGLHDQRLLLQWVQDYIALFGGDPTRVSAWGESAGAGSILHHLVREGGNVDPLFRTYMVQSPAFEWSWNNTKDGTMDMVYRNFSQLAGCGYKYDIDCLTNADKDAIVEANNKLFDNIKPTGLFPVGPSVDGSWVQKIPTLSFASGQYWKNITSALVSHVYNETASFTPRYIVSQDSFDYFLALFFPGPKLESIRHDIKKQYNCRFSYDGDFRRCAATLIRDSTFTCNTRDLFDAFPDYTYMLRYSFLMSKNAAVHASDLVPTFMRSREDAYNTFRLGNVSRIDSAGLAEILHDGGLMRKYQAWLASFGVAGSPNFSGGRRRRWPRAVGGEEISKVMEVYGTGHTRLISDDQNKKSTCSFWADIAQRLMKQD